jgi:hypothetical protein
MMFVIDINDATQSDDSLSKSGNIPKGRFGNILSIKY